MKMRQVFSKPVEARQFGSNPWGGSREAKAQGKGQAERLKETEANFENHGFSTAYGPYTASTRTVATIFSE